MTNVNMELIEKALERVDELREEIWVTFPEDLRSKLITTEDGKRLIQWHPYIQMLEDVKLSYLHFIYEELNVNPIEDETLGTDSEINSIQLKRTSSGYIYTIYGKVHKHKPTGKFSVSNKEWWTKDQLFTLYGHEDDEDLTVPMIEPYNPTGFADLV